MFFSVVCVQIHLPDFAHQGITGIGAGALIVKGLLHHSVQPVKEIFLIGYIIPDRRFDTHIGFQVVDHLDQPFQLFRVIAALHAQCFRHLCVAAQCMGMVVLREGAHLGGHFSGVEAQHFFNHQRVGNTVRNVMERAQLMRHGMAYPQESVGKGHARHGGRVGHLFPCFHIGETVVVSPGQILKNGLQRFDRQAVGIIRGHHGGVGFQRVGHGIDAAGGGEAFRRGHMEISIDDRHVGQQLIVSQRILDSALFIGNDGEGRHLTAGTGGGGNSNEISFLAHPREGIYPLADIHEAHRHILEIHFRMLIQDPHDFACIHGASAAQGDDHVGLEQAHLLRASLGARQGGIGGYIKEGGVLDAQLVQLLRDRRGVAVVIQEIVGHDKGFLFAHHVF